MDRAGEEKPAQGGLVLRRQVGLDRNLALALFGLRAY